MTTITKYLANLLALMLLIAAGCAVEPVPQGVDSKAAVSVSERQIVLTVPQSHPVAFRVNGAPVRPYIRRSSYRSSAETERVLNQLAANYALRRIDGWHIASLGVYCEVFEVPVDRSIAETLTRMKSDARVESAQRMNVFSVLGHSSDLGHDDPYVGMQSAITMLQLDAAHLWSRGHGITVAVIDTGVDRRHPELRKNVVAMVDFVGSGKRAGTRDVHGTAIAGVIASQAGNGIGIVGVAPEVEVVALRACWPIRAGATEARCSSFTLAKALEFAIADDVDVLNLSLTGPSDPLLLRLIGVALDRGILVVAAADPDRREAGFPASRPGVISVDVAGGDWRRSPTGEAQQFQVVAPGTDVLTTTPEGNFGFLSGSSIAAAHVSGVTALLLERAPHLSRGEVASLLTGSIRQVDGTYSVNACLALADLLQLSGCGSKEMARQ